MSAREPLETAYRAEAQGRPLRGNLHTHSTRSDGAQEIQEVVRGYAKRGYDFLMMSDHDILADLTGLDPCGMVLIRGNEVSARGPHILDVGARAKIEPVGDRQAVIDAINRAGGFAILNHPNWEDDFNHYPFELMLALKDYAGIEIVNGGTLGAPGSHLAVDKWDRLLSSGRRVLGFANDDSHSEAHMALGWNVAFAAEKSAAAALEALRSGNFYASTGVGIREIYADGSAIVVRAPEADAMAVVGDHGARLAWIEKPELRFETAAVFASYFRIECYGRAGRMAWSQPFYATELRERLERLESAERPVLKALRAERAPQFTGTLDDELWRKAPKAEQFYLMSTGVDADVKTEAAAILAPDALYLGARCDEPNMDKLRLNAKADGHFALWNDDSIEFFLGLDGTDRGYVQVQANALGFSGAAPMGIDLSRVPKVEAKAVRGAKGWTAEIRVPLEALKAKTAPGSRWKLHICRNRTQADANFVWAWVGKSNHNPHKFGWLAF